MAAREEHNRLGSNISGKSVTRAKNGEALYSSRENEYTSLKDLRRTNKVDYKNLTTLIKHLELDVKEKDEEIDSLNRELDKSKSLFDLFVDSQNKKLPRHERLINYICSYYTVDIALIKEMNNSRLAVNARYLILYLLDGRMNYSFKDLKVIFPKLTFSTLRHAKNTTTKRIEDKAFKRDVKIHIKWMEVNI